MRLSSRSPSTLRVSARRIGMLQLPINRVHKARVDVLRATDVFQMSQAGSVGPAIAACWPVVLVFLR